MNEGVNYHSYTRRSRINLHTIHIHITFSTLLLLEQTLGSFLVPSFQLLTTCSMESYSSLQMAVCKYPNSSSSFDSLHQGRRGGGGGISKPKVRLRLCLVGDHSPLALYPGSFSCAGRGNEYGYEANSPLYHH